MNPQREALSLFVPGKPAPQGSKNVLAHGAVVESSRYLKPWRADIRAAFTDHNGWCSPGVPVLVELEFLMTRPKSHYRTGRNSHRLRDQAPPRPTGKPDVDKLARAVLDAITSAGVWKDDSQVVDLRSVKRWADWVDLHETSGCHIRISEETEQ